MEGSILSFEPSHSAIPKGTQSTGNEKRKSQPHSTTSLSRQTALACFLAPAALCLA